MPPQSPKWEADYVLLGLATNSRIGFTQSAQGGNDAIFFATKARRH